MMDIIKFFGKVLKVVAKVVTAVVKVVIHAVQVHKAKKAAAAQAAQAAKQQEQDTAMAATLTARRRMYAFGATVGLIILAVGGYFLLFASGDTKVKPA